jgi:uncharacterized protein (TIGR02246 family)
MMTEDERAIRTVVDTWMSASRAGDLPTILSLMADDAIFMVPGREPFGKQEFAVNAQGMKDAHIEGTNNILEIQVLGDWAYLRNHIEMTAIPAGGGAAAHRSGYTLTLMRKGPDGRWRLARDANLMTAER